MVQKNTVKKTLKSVEMFRRSDKFYQSDYNLPVKMCLFS